MITDKEKYWDKLVNERPKVPEDAAERDEAWSNEDSLELSGLLENPTMRRALAICLAQSQFFSANVLALDFTDPKAGVAASKQQGKVEGVTTTLETLIDLALQEPTGGENDD